MAQNQVVMGLLEELGLGDVNEQQLLQQAIQQQGGSGGSSLAAVMHNVGRELGQGVAPAVGGLFQTAKNSLSKDEDGKRQGGFNFSQGVRDMKDNTIAQQMGLSGKEELRTRRESKAAISALNFVATGDPIKDQQAALDLIIKTANQHGDARTVAAAMKKKVQIEAQAKEFAKQDTEQASEDLKLKRAEETDSAGRTVHLVGDAKDGAVSKAIQQEDGSWKVWRPDGTVEEGVDGGRLIFVDPSDLSGARQRQFETADGQLSTALKLNGLTGQAINKPRNYVTDMGIQAVIVDDMTQSLLDMHNPDIAFSDSSKAAVAADRTLSFVETVSSLFTRTGDDQSDTTYNGKKVSGELQMKEATSVGLYEEFLTEQGLDLHAVLPDHIRADTREAQLFMANVMQLAYLDARLQEPANRGLSDSDIKNALSRIGAGSPDPRVFALRQKQNVTRLQGSMKNLGLEYAPTSAVGRQEIIDHVYTPELRAKVDSHLAKTQATLDRFLSPETAEAATSVGADMSDEDLDARIAELEEEERRKKEGQ